MASRPKTRKPKTPAAPASPRAGAVPPLTPQRLSELVTEWRAYLETELRLADASITTYLGGMRKFLEWCRAVEIRDVNEKAVGAWLKSLEKRYRPGTVSTWYAAVRAHFAWALRHERLAHDPTAGITAQRRHGIRQAHKRRPLRDHEVLQVLRQPDASTPAGARDRAIIALMSYAAVRSVEIHRARHNDLKPLGDRLILAVHGKGRAEADQFVVIAHPELRQALYDWLAARAAWLAEHWPEERPDPEALFISLSDRSRGQALSLAAIRRLVKRYFGAAGVHDELKTTHSLRHSAITSAIEHGAPIQKVQTMARHASIATTMIYYSESSRLKDPAEDFVDYGEPGRDE